MQSTQLLIVGIRLLLSAVCVILFRTKQIRNRTPLFILLLVTIGALQWVVVEWLHNVDFRTPPMTLDAAFFQHAGWLVTIGEIPYIDIWDIKPPLTLTITTVLAWIAQGNTLILHLLSVIVSVSFAVGSLWMASAVIGQLNDNPAAKLVAPLCLLSAPGYLTFALTGFRPRFAFLFFGLLAIWLSHLSTKPSPSPSQKEGDKSPSLRGGLRGGNVRSILQRFNDPSFFAGVSAALSIAIYLPGLIFVCLTLWLNRRTIGRTLIGILLVALLTIAPIYRWNAIIPMLNQVIIIPLIISENVSLLLRLRGLLMFTKYAAILLPTGLIASMFLARKTAWLPCFLLGGIALLLIDLDGYPDLFLVMLICGLAIAVWESKIGWLERYKPSFSLILAIISIVWMGGFNIIHTPVSRTYYIDNPATTAATPNMRTLYWNKTVLDDCHYRLSKLEVAWIEMGEDIAPDTADSPCLVPQTIDETITLLKTLR